MRRSGPLLVVVAAALALGGCGGDDDAEPGIPTVDFTPTASIDVTADGLGCGLETVVVTERCEVPAGSVVEVRNRTDADARVRGGDLFDTGRMEPGDTTTVVLAAPGDVEVETVGPPDATLTVVVTPREG